MPSDEEEEGLMRDKGPKKEVIGQKVTTLLRGTDMEREKIRQAEEHAISYYKKQIAELKAGVKALSEQVDANHNAYLEEQERANKLDANLASAQQELTRYKTFAKSPEELAQRLSNLSSSVATANQKSEALDREKNDLQQRFEQKGSEISSIRSELEQVTNAHKSCGAVQAELDKYKTQLGSYEDVQKKFARLERALEEIAQKDGLIGKLRAVEAAHKACAGVFAELEKYKAYGAPEDLAIMNKLLEEYKRRGRPEEVETKLAELTDALNGLRAENSRLSNELMKSQTENVVLEVSKKAWEVDKRKLQEELAAKKAEVQRYDSRNKGLQQSLDEYVKLGTPEEIQRSLGEQKGHITRLEDQLRRQEEIGYELAEELEKINTEKSKK